MNALRVWWHCLWRTFTLPAGRHRWATIYDVVGTPEHWCSGCGYRKNIRKA